MKINKFIFGIGLLFFFCIQAFGQLKEGQSYMIIATHSNKALEIKPSANMIANGLQLQQNDSTGKDNQLFYFKRIQGGYFQIIAKCSNKVLEVRNGSLKDHDSIQQNQPNGADYQLFSMVKLANGAYAIVNKNSGYGFDVLGGSKAFGNNLAVIQYQVSGAPNQAFRIVSTDKSRNDLCTPNPSKEAVALYKYLLDMKGKKILSGQMSTPWGFDEFEYIKTNTGKLPAIKGVDFIDQIHNAGEVQKAIDWWKGGGIPTIMWHWGAPSIGEGYEASKKPIEIDNCFIEGTAENKAFWAELKTKGDLLQKLKDANVPVLFRPFHELNGNWFWWGKQGPEKFKKLWTTMFNYYVKERGFNNLIWVLCYTGQPDATWYPGDQYVDIVGADTYDSGDGPQMGMFNKVKSITNDKFPIAYHECGIPPNPDQCRKDGGMWSWWMEWHTSWLTRVDKNYLKFVYNHDLVITLDKVPDIMAKYGLKSKE